MIKHEMWALIRCLWINLIRIVNFMEKACKKTYEKAVNSALLKIFTRIFINWRLVVQVLSKFLENFAAFDV